MARITSKQKSARRKNIAVARAAKKKSGGKKGGFYKSAIKRAGGVKALQAAVAGDRAKWTGRAKAAANTPERYSKRKRLRKKAEMHMLAKYGNKRTRAFLKSKRY